MAKLKKTRALAEAMLAQWLKRDPFVKIITQGDDEVRWMAMRNLLGKKAATKHFGPLKSTKKRKRAVAIITPHHILQQELLFLKDRKKRSKIIKLLRFWGIDPYINTNNINSHLTRQQIVLSLLGPIFLRANKVQEKLILTAIEEIATQRISGYNSKGELSPDVHQVILTKIIEILDQHFLIKARRQQATDEEKFKIHLIREISELKEKKQPAPFYHPSFQTSDVNVEERYPLSESAVITFRKILEFYCYCPWPQFRQTAKDFYQEKFKGISLTRQANYQ